MVTWSETNANLYRFNDDYYGPFIRYWNGVNWLEGAPIRGTSPGAVFSLIAAFNSEQFAAFNKRIQFGKLSPSDLQYLGAKGITSYQRYYGDGKIVADSRVPSTSVSYGGEIMVDPTLPVFLLKPPSEQTTEKPFTGPFGFWKFPLWTMIKNKRDSGEGFKLGLLGNS